MPKSEKRTVDIALNVQESSKGPDLPVEDGSEGSLGKKRQRTSVRNLRKP